MYENFNSRLKEVKEKCGKKRKWEHHLARVENHLLEEQGKSEKQLMKLMKEKEDVEKLESLSLANLFYIISGKKLEKLDLEKQEVLAATLKYNEAEESVKDLEKEIQEYKKLLATVTGCEEEYLWILDEKERLIHNKDSFWSAELYEITEIEAETELMIKEYEEAINTGEIAKNGLSEAIKSLDTAKGWSTFDMFGGGMITTAIKHSHIDTAKGSIHQVQHELRIFQDELLDIKEHFKVDLEVGNFLTFADYFFDGLIVDWTVHGKINDSLQQVNDIYGQVTSLLRELSNKSNHLQQELKGMQEKRAHLIESV